MQLQNLLINSAATYSKQDLVDIYERHSDELFRYSYRLVGDRDLAEDCVSEIFSRFLRTIREGQGPRENLRAYLFRMAHNWITDYYRRHPLPHLPLEEEFHAGIESNPSQVVAREMDSQRMRAALLRLPPEQRQVVELRFLEDWSHEEVAASLGKTVEATRAMQHRALEALRRMLVD